MASCCYQSWLEFIFSDYLDFTIAITHNFMCKFNLAYAYLKTRFSRPKLTDILVRKLRELSNINNDKSEFYKGCLSEISQLNYIPALFTSSDISSSESSESYESDISSCSCKKCTN